MKTLPKLIPHGTLNGAGMYKSADGRFVFSSSMSHAHARSGKTRQRWWTVADMTRKDGCGYYVEIAMSTTLTVCRERLEKFLAAERTNAR